MNFLVFDSAYCSRVKQASIRATLFTLLLVVGAFPRAASAQDAPPGGGGAAVEITGWDLSDPTNHAESREFFAELWTAQDAGLPPPEFVFTNPPPGLFLAMLLPELEVFHEIYQHRLRLEFEDDRRYLVTDLIADDDEVRAAFRIFVLTGKLAPPPELDPAAYDAHFGLVIDALTVQQRATIDGVRVVGALVESAGMVVDLPRGHSIGDAPPILWDPAHVDCALRLVARASRLSCLAELGLHTQGRGTRLPDFDCDDFAEAMYWFLRRHLSSQFHPELLYLTWKCGSVSFSHSIVVVEGPGGWFWIEPQAELGSGDFHGPYANPVDARLGWMAWATANGVVGSSCTLKPFFRRYYPDPLGVHPAAVPWHDVPSWFTDRAQVARFCERYAQCCERALVLDCNPGPYLPDIDRLRGCNIRWYMPPAWPDPPGSVPNPDYMPPVWPGPGLPCGYPTQP